MKDRERKKRMADRENERQKERETERMRHRKRKRTKDRLIERQTDRQNERQRLNERQSDREREEKERKNNKVEFFWSAHIFVIPTKFTGVTNRRFSGLEQRKIINQANIRFFKHKQKYFDKR
jgi:hypothetical protein